MAQKTLRTRYQRERFAVGIAQMLMKHEDPDVRDRAEVIYLALAAPIQTLQGYLSMSNIDPEIKGLLELTLEGK